jgi:hypothetical protein
MKVDRLRAVARLWKAHGDAAFAGRLRFVDVAGVEMVMLDADVTGCVNTWLNNNGTIDDWRWNVLAARERQLKRVVPELSGDEAAYYRRLLDMTVLVLDSSGDQPPA